jgi:hypothetical protein
MGAETRLIVAAPASRWHRLSSEDQKLVWLLLAEGDGAGALLSVLAEERREVLAPLVAELAQLARHERRALLAASAPPAKAEAGSRVCRERSRLLALMSRRAPPPGPLQPDFDFKRLLERRAR